MVRSDRVDPTAARLPAGLTRRRLMERRAIFARLFVVVAMAGVVLGLGAAPASAHAVLEATTPTDGSALPSGSPPKVVTLRFDEGVVAATDSVQLFDGRGRAVKVTTDAHGLSDKVVRASLPKLADGTYVVTWRVVSDDSHPVQGAFSFGVGAAASTGAGAQGLLSSRSGDPAVGFAFGAVRGLAFLGLLVLVGGLAFVAWCWPQARERRDISTLLAVSLGAVIVTSLLGIALQAAYVSGGGVASAFDGSHLRDVMSTRFGRAWTARAVLAAVLFAVSQARSRLKRGAGALALDAVFVVVALACLMTFTYAGHGDTGRLVATGFVADLTHLGAAALWLGGIAVLAIGLRDPHRLWGAARATERFSRLALPAVVVLALSGTVQAWRQIGTWSALWHTTYGHLLTAKVLVFSALVVAAYASRDVLRLRVVPALRTALGPGAARREADPEDAVELRNGVWVEATLAIVVLALTAALVNAQPAREAAAQTPHTYSSTLVASPMRFDIAVQPALRGNDTIVVTPHLDADNSGSIFRLSATLSLPGRVAPIPLAFAPLGDGRYAANAVVPLAGNWKLEVRCLRTAVDESVAVTTIRFG